jgi:hypothetical protein
LGSESGVAEDSRLQGNDALSLGEYILIFERHSGPFSNCQDLLIQQHIITSQKTGLFKPNAGCGSVNSTDQLVL